MQIDQLSQTDQVFATDPGLWMAVPLPGQLQNLEPNSKSDLSWNGSANVFSNDLRTLAGYTVIKNELRKLTRYTEE